MTAIKNPFIWLTLAILLGVAALATGCQTAGKAIVASSVTVDAAMQGWAVYVVDGQASPTDEDVVRRALAKYRLAEQAALDAYLEFSKTGDKTKWAQARDYLLSQQSNLLRLIEELKARQR